MARCHSRDYRGLDGVFGDRDADGIIKVITIFNTRVGYDEVA